MKHNKKTIKLNRITNKFISVFLSLCMTASMVSGTVFAAVSGPTEKIVDGTRVADPSTMDDYQNQLLSMESGSRYAGRVWTDKSVFAYDKNGENKITLDMATDGYDGSVGYNADFAHTFSALASSQVVNEYPPSPIDLVIVFDMSGSMGQDTRYDIDSGNNGYVKAKDGKFPENGVPMDDRIENSRIQKTLDAINNTIDGLMKQNPQNRVAVCGYGANAVVIMPLAHYKRVDDKQPYLSVGGMETLYYPGDLKLGEDNVWYWQNNRDTCYTVVANAEMNTYTGPLDDNSSEAKEWTKHNFTVSNNINSNDVKAFPGVEKQDKDGLEKSQEFKTSSESIANNKWNHGDANLKNAMENTKHLTADDYVGYFTNTQGGIYLAYKQLADSTVTTYSETLSTGVMSTVARIPATIIMSDGGANFAFNEMGNDQKDYTVDDWNNRYAAKRDKSPIDDPNGNLDEWYMTDDTWDSSDNDGHNKDHSHRLGNPSSNVGDEWYNVYLPGDDTLEKGKGKEGGTTEDGNWDGLHGIYNTGADFYQEGTLSTAPSCYSAGVLYNSDNDRAGTGGTVMEVLLTASYMNNVVKKHYENGWHKNNATAESMKNNLSTYTMNVDTKHVPQWGRWRLFPTLDPKEYALDDIGKSDDTGWGSETWNETKDSKLGDSYNGDSWGSEGQVYIKAGAFTKLKESWDKWKSGEKTDFSMGNGIRINLSRLENDSITYDAGGDDEVTVTNDDIINNIAYNDKFYDVDSEKLDEIFDEILTIILGKIFVPVSGDNDAGVGDSITYQDPIGEYMEVKNQSIKAKTHNDEEKGQDAQNYDMSLLLFGKMHGIVRTGIYDYQWNDKWMKAHKGTEQGEKAMPMGWYKGEDAASAEFAANPDGSAASLPSGCSTAEEAWGNGWVYRLDFKTFTSYVPIVDTPDTPDELSQQAKNTKYTLYRFAGTAAERNELYINPIYGEKVPEAAQKAFDEKCERDAEGNIISYPEGNGTYAEYDGVYRLSDIRVWLEDTGDFVDQDGAITPNSGYERSLYLNIPAAAVPTQLAEITLGKDGVLSYETNLGSDHKDAKKDEDGNGTSYEEYCAQSTPFRLFYAVGLEEDLILRDSSGNQVGVDFNAISAEYISAHTVAGQDYVYFISNFYSNTTYNDYVTDTATARTRGDPTVTFSPSSDNRYYVFQKPLPLYAHAYRVEGENLKAVDRADGESWSKEENQTGGNGKTTWETVGGAVQQPGSWSGGQFMGVYKSQDDFQKKIKEATASGGNTITDDHNTKYEVAENGVVFLEQDLMEHVTSDGSGYTKGSVSFSSDDYFFILVEYYLPDENSVGQDDKGNEVSGTYGGKMVQRVVSRRGSEFGSGFASDQIDNGDMLCWTDMGTGIGMTLEYYSHSTTGDDTRGEPTYEKLFSKNETALRNYLKNECGLRDTTIDEETKSPLDEAVEYYKGIQEKYHDILMLADSDKDGKVSEEEYKSYFRFAVAARPGGIRSGDMSNNRHAKTDNKTSTANNYYVPTVSDDSGTDNNVILDTYLGNNGRLEIANQMLHVTKMLKAPEGFTLTEDQLNKEFNYQLFVQGVTGTRTAVRTLYNEYSDTWERRLAYIDVLTDNSELLLDNNDNRALFDLGDGNTARLVVQGESGLCYADDDGEPTDKTCTKTENELYYLYLPSNNDAAAGSGTSVRRLYQDSEYSGEDKVEDEALDKNGRTTFFAEGQREETGSEPGAENRDSYRKATADGTRPAGTRSYWALDAELISVSEVKEAEGESNGVMLDAVKLWNHDGAIDKENNHQKLSYYTFIIRKPNDKTSLSDFSSPFKTRTLYMTTTLTFGVNNNKNDGSAENGTLSADDLYDQIIPNGDRPDLFGNLDNETIAKSTAEFTLQHGEGLLVTGLDNKITYRFTEKLSEEDVAAGYKLQEISHIQQRGSDSIYRLGKQEIPVYSHENATYGNYYPKGFENNKTEGGLTWAVDQSGQSNLDAYRHLEPFYHTNAVMWEYYAAADSTGNHHQTVGTPQEDKEKSSFYLWYGNENKVQDGVTDIVEDNPNCAKCDEKLPDDSIRHYMYRNGELVDPHYEGEASSFLRSMSRCLVSPTVHFAMKGENQEYANKALPVTQPFTDYTGVYSVFGDTGWFEEQVHYTNTYSVEPTEYAPQVNKTVRGNAPSDETFTFNIKASADNPDGAVLPTDTTATVKGAGTASFGNITFSKVGTYKFEIRETAGESLGCTYDDSVWTLTVVVENVDSALAVTSHTYTKADGTASSDNAEFENVYVIPTEYAPKVKKTVKGDTPSDKTFTFNITASEENPDGAILPEDKTATVTGAGTASFGNITFSKAGTYNFEIKETKGKDTGYTYDESIWTLTVVVVDNDSQLEVQSYSYTKADGTKSNDGAEFTNTYSVEPTEFTPKVSKTVKGDTPSDKTFTFNITASEENPENGAILPEDKTATVTGAGTASFGNITFSKTGTYNFEIKETKLEEAGYTYDESVWTLTVVVVDNESQLEVQSYSYTKADGTTSNDGAEFTNTYNVNSTEFTPKVNKTVKGDTPSDKTFTFNITASEDNPNGASLPTDTSATVTGSGSTNFGNIKFTKTGTYNFEIKEEQGKCTRLQL